MSYQAFVRAAAGVLAAAAMAGGALAQSTTQPSPATMTDTAPLPAHDRQSTGAIILMDQPVLAQREAMLAAQERSAVDTRAMGAGPARILRDVFTKKELEQKRAQDAAEGAPVK
jgi:methenyltetrahydromethanopterin cyclohydrolase